MPSAKSSAGQVFHWPDMYRRGFTACGTEQSESVRFAYWPDGVTCGKPGCLKLLQSYRNRVRQYAHSLTEAEFNAGRWQMVFRKDDDLWELNNIDSGTRLTMLEDSDIRELTALLEAVNRSKRERGYVASAVKTFMTALAFQDGDEDTPRGDGGVTE